MKDRGRQRTAPMVPRLMSATVMVWLSTLVLLSLSASAATAITSETTVSVITILPTLDATIDESSRDTNYGHASDLQFISATPGRGGVESVVKFDLSDDNNGRVIAADGIQSAHLRLYATGGCDFAQYQLSDQQQLGLVSVGLASASEDGTISYGEGDVEYERFITWNEAPQHLTVSIAAGKTSSSSVIYQPLDELNANSWLEVDVTSFILNSTVEGRTEAITMRIGSALFASIDSMPSLSLCNFASKELNEGNFSPELVLQIVEDYKATSESSTMKEARRRIEDRRVDGTINRSSMSECAPPYTPDKQYNNDEIASNDGNNYMCTGPYRVWCGHEAYVPGEGTTDYWTMAWKLIEECQTYRNPDSMTDGEFKMYKATSAMKATPKKETFMTQNSGRTAMCAMTYESRDFKVGQTVSHEGKNYECKQNGWCGFEAYAPGASAYWNMAWTYKGDCTSSQAQNTLGVGFTSYGSTSCPPPWQLHHTYQSKERVIAPSTAPGSTTTTNIVYECKEYPFTASCGDPASEVGTGAMYKSVWRVVGMCDEANGQVIEGSVANSGSPLETILGRREEQPTRRPTRQQSNLSKNNISSPSQSTSGGGPIMVVRPAPTIDQGDDDDDDCGPKFQGNGNKSYTDEDIVSFQGSNYRCTLPKWCGMPNSIRKYGTLVWEELGSCDDRNISSSSNTGNNSSGNEVKKPADLVSGNSPTSSLVSQPARPTRPTVNKPASKPKPAAIIPAGNNVDSSANLMVDGQQGDEDELGLGQVAGNNVDSSANLIVDGQQGDEDELGLGQAAGNNVDSSANLMVDGQLGDEEELGLGQACPPMWVLDHSYSEGETVGANWQVYRCKGHPYTGWCGASAFYEPGVGTVWGQAWEMVADCVGQGTRWPTPLPTSNPTRKPTTSNPTREPTTKSPSGDDDSFSGNFAIGTNVESTSETVFDMLDSKSSLIDSTLFLYQGSEPSQVYRYEGFISGLRIMVEDGVAGKQFYLGNGDPDNGHLYGLVNIAAFIGQSMKETIQYDACDENSWDILDMVYPLSNACGQLGQSYQEYHCPEHQRHMECEVDPDMSIKATTHAKWYGAPGPLFCGPKSEYPETGIWDYNYNCHNPWAEPPEYCTDYEGQKAGRVDHTVTVENRNGRTDVEGCCWWGRGVIQTTGICNFGKLNYFLGKRAKDDGRDSRYPEIDFCKDPGIICSSEEHKELKWIAGMFYWIESLQSYEKDGWNYMNELHNFVDTGMANHDFINAVSGIVNRGCHNPPCGTGPVDGLHERAGNFNTVLSTLNS